MRPTAEQRFLPLLALVVGVVAPDNRLLYYIPKNETTAAFCAWCVIPSFPRLPDVAHGRHPGVNLNQPTNTAFKRLVLPAAGSRIRLRSWRTVGLFVSPEITRESMPIVSCSTSELVSGCDSPGYNLS